MRYQNKRISNRYNKTITRSFTTTAYTHFDVVDTGLENIRKFIDFDNNSQSTFFQSATNDGTSELQRTNAELLRYGQMRIKGFKLRIERTSALAVSNTTYGFFRPPLTNNKLFWLMTTSKIEDAKLGTTNGGLVPPGLQYPGNTPGVIGQPDPNWSKSEWIKRHPRVRQRHSYRKWLDCKSDWITLSGAAGNENADQIFTFAGRNNLGYSTVNGTGGRLRATSNIFSQFHRNKYLKNGPLSGFASTTEDAYRANTVLCPRSLYLLIGATSAAGGVAERYEFKITSTLVYQLRRLSTTFTPTAPAISAYYPPSTRTWQEEGKSYTSLKQHGLEIVTEHDLSDSGNGPDVLNAHPDLMTLFLVHKMVPEKTNLQSREGLKRLITDLIPYLSDFTDSIQNCTNTTWMENMVVRLLSNLSDIGVKIVLPSCSTSTTPLTTLTTVIQELRNGTKIFENAFPIPAPALDMQPELTMTPME